ncbi:MAG TPA: NEW3 domain-containing protein [Puia sp.]|nr:NEW3 domain-containing protein [Puia sp.]
MTMLAKLTRSVYFFLLTTPLLAIPFSRSMAQSFYLYTPLTEISVPPGQSIDYSIDVVNKGGSPQSANLAVEGLPHDWTYQLKSGGWNVKSISVLPGEKKNFSLQLQVPLKVNKGTYHFSVRARGLTELPLAVVVSQQGTFRTELTTDQSNMAGAANSTFTFNAKLRNSTDAAQAYALNTMAPPGWKVSFKANYKQVSSVNIEPGHIQDITIDVDPPDETAAGTYRIPIVATTGATSADLPLTVSITGSYSMQLTTPTGLLSTTTTAGDHRRLELVVKNTGSAELKNIDLTSTLPANWDVSFDPKKIDDLPPGQTAQVSAILTPDQKAIAGDYMADLRARAAEASAVAPLRVSVETSLLWSWAGILIILVAVGSVYFLFRKYGRR